MLVGIDISTWQGNNTHLNDGQFCIIRSTYGIYKDNRFEQNAKAWSESGKPFGFYHFAYPNRGTTPKQEAVNFIQTIKPYLGKCLLVLDYEAEAHKTGEKWALEFMDYVYNETGVKPLFYTNAGALGKYPNIAKKYKLWVAHWGVQNPITKPWATYTLWQYRGSPLDLDYFNGTVAEWKKLCKISEDENIEVGDIEMPQIKKGSKGKAVKIWQVIVGVTADGIFGNDTYNATIKFQSKHKDGNGKPLVQDGIVGKLTWRAGLESVH